MKELQGKVAVVTGAGSGIGRATCEALARRGVDVAILDIDVEGAEATLESVRRLGGDGSTYRVDVRSAEQLADAADRVLERHGGCQILVNNAGVTSAGSFEAEPIEDLRWIVDINVWGVLNGCRAFLPMLRSARGGAHIVNVASMVALLGLPHNASYSLTKGAVRSFSEALRGELGPAGIGVSAVFPGAIRTNITEVARGADSARLVRMGRSPVAPLIMRPPESVARAIVRAVEHDRARVVVGPDAHVVSVVSRLVPGRTRLMGRLTNRLATNRN